MTTEIMDSSMPIGNGVRSIDSLPKIECHGVRVMTTELLAGVYGTEAVRIRQNHSNNRSRFIEGKHFFKVHGADLEALRVAHSDLQISSRTRSLMLWTARGSARHAKILDTEQAWAMFEKLEDAYFSRSPADVADIKLQMEQQRMDLASRRLQVQEMNAARNTFMALSRAGVKAQLVNAPAIFAKVGITIDLSMSNAFDQGEFDLDPPEEAGETGTEEEG